MFSALFLKALRQQRALVAAGIGTGALFALGLRLVIGGANGPGPIETEVGIGSALPRVLLLGVWPFWALLAVSQAFTGDREAGTEPFLLDRPVPPRRLFTARLLAAFAAWTTVAGATYGLAWILARAVYEVPIRDGPDLIRVGLALSGVAASGTLLAAAVGASSLVAVLLGLMLGLPALAAAALFLRAFPVLFESVGWISLWPIALAVLAGPAAAWLGLTRGEPAGRGRVGRIVRVMGVAMLAIAALFVAITPGLIRTAMGGSKHWRRMELAPGSRSAVLSHYHRSMWVVDPVRGVPLRFIPPRSRFLGWRSDGAMFAVATSATRLGSQTKHERITIYGADGGLVAPEITLERDEELIPGVEDWVLWVGDELFFMTEPDAEARVLWRAQPGKEQGRLAAARLPARTRPLQVTADGMLYLFTDWRHVGRDKPAGWPYPSGEVDPIRFDPRSGRLERLDAIPVRQLYSGLAPSGRYWLVDDGQRGAARIVVRDLTSGREQVHEFDGTDVREWEWLAEDRLAIVVGRADRDSSLILTGPGGGGTREELVPWAINPSMTGRPQASPDGELLLIEDHDSGNARIFRPADSRWTTVPPPPELRSKHPLTWTWAGAKTLVVPGAQGPLLIDVDAPERVRTIAF
ncbi:MAG: ABC transporter permease [Acidobacteria bacterium]|nr:ABC transporter permease [Acidobacteriota bacterium]